MYGKDNTGYQLFTGAPLPLRWWGWETTTHILHREGWELLSSQEKDFEHRGTVLRIGAKSPDGVVMISGCVLFRDEYAFGQDRMYTSPRFSGLPPIDALFREGGMRMNQYSAKDRFAVMKPMDFTSMNAMKPFDPYASTEFCPRTDDYRALELFKSKPEIANEIYIPSNSVTECLNRILQLQYPEQQKIKENLIMPGAKPIIQAKILSLAA